MAGRWLDVGDAAKALGVSTDAVRKRIARKTLRSDRRDGRVVVWLDDGGMGESEALASPPDALIEAKDETIRVLLEQLEAERDAHREARRIIAGLVQRIPELEAPAQPEDSQRSETAAQETAEAAPGPAPRPSGVDDSRASERPWWQRWFG